MSPFDRTRYRRVAVIGGGITGMGAAYDLARDHRVTLFEAEKGLGGHARTRFGGKNGDQAVDTGFIVFNYANYPNLTALFDELSVPVVKSDMTFGASFDGGRYEYGLRDLKAVFAQKRNLFEFRHYAMIRDILRVNDKGLALARADKSLSIGGLLKALGTGDWFRDRYLLPLSGAIWSTPVEKILDFPAYAMMDFFENHALLNHTGQHQWYTVDGGSRSYVWRLENALIGRGVDIRTSAPVAGIERVAGKVRIRATGGDWETFDEVVLATHCDDSLRLLSDATLEERSALGGMKYQPNRVLFHSDASVMPKRKAVWSSWNYTEIEGRGEAPIDLTYWMNSLQPWLTGEQFFVTLNTERPVREDLIWDEVTLRHPVYDAAALDTRTKVNGINGRNGTWFCGAWMRNGFHEDGLSSGMAVASALRAASLTSVAAE